MPALTGHYKRESSSIKTADGWTFTLEDGHFPEALFTVKGAGKPLESFLRFAAKLLDGGGEWCDTDDNGNPVSCATNVDYPDGSTRKGQLHRPHLNAVYRIKGLPHVLAAIAEHSSILNVEKVFCYDARPPRAGTGQASGDVSAVVKRAMRSRDRRDREALRTDPAAREAVLERDAMAFATAKPDYATLANRTAEHRQTVKVDPLLTITRTMLFYMS